MIYTKWSIRLFSYLLDVFLILFISRILMKFIGLHFSFFLWMSISGLLAVLYFFLFLCFVKGQTFAGLIFQIRVASEDGTELGWKKSLIRGALMSVVFIPDYVSLIMIGLFIHKTMNLRHQSPYKERMQTALDFFSKTCVVNLRKS